MEAALKMARQYYVEKGKGRRRHIMGCHQSCHGNTLGALAAGGNEWRRAQFQPLLVETITLRCAMHIVVAYLPKVSISMVSA